MPRKADYTFVSCSGDSQITSSSVGNWLLLGSPYRPGINAHCCKDNAATLSKKLPIVLLIKIVPLLKLTYKQLKSSHYIKLYEFGADSELHWWPGWNKP